MQADLKLKTRQAFWETPRNLFVAAAAFAAIVATLAGLAGYKLGSQPPQTIILQLPPGLNTGSAPAK